METQRGMLALGEKAAKKVAAISKITHSVPVKLGEKAAKSRPQNPLTTLSQTATRPHLTVWSSLLYVVACRLFCASIGSLTIKNIKSTGRDLALRSVSNLPIRQGAKSSPPIERGKDVFDISNSILLRQ